jgi:hypothetical protein
VDGGGGEIEQWTSMETRNFDRFFPILSRRQKNQLWLSPFLSLE